MIKGIRPSQARISMDVGRASGPSAVGVEGAALERLGQTISSENSRTISAFSDLAERRRKSRIAEFGDNQSFEYRKRVGSRLLEANKKYEGTNYDGYSEEVQQIIREERESVINSAPNTDSATYFDSKIKGFSENISLRSMSDENLNRSKYTINKRLERGEALASQAFTDPNPFTVNDELLTYETEVRAMAGVDFSPGQSDKLVSGVRKTARSGLINGLIHNNLNGLTTDTMTLEDRKSIINDFLDGKVKGTEQVFEGMSVEEKARYSRQMTASAEQAIKTQTNEIRGDVRQAVSVIMNENPVNPNVQKEIFRMKKRLATLPEGDAKQEMLSQIQAAETVSEVSKSAHFKSSADISRMKPEEFLPISGLDNADMNIKAQNLMKRKLAGILAEREEDGQAYMEKYFPGFANNPDASIEHQKQMGISQPRVMSKSMASTQASAFLESGSPMERAAMLDDIIRNYGSEHAYQAMSEMADENKDFHRGYAFTGFFKNNDTRIKLITALSQRSQNKEKYDNVFGKGSLSSLKDQVQSDMQSFNHAWQTSDLHNVGGEMNEMVEAYAMEYRLKNPGTSLDDAVGKVKEHVIDTNFSIFESDGKSIIIPKVSQNNEKVVESFLKNSLRNYNKRYPINQEYLKSLGVDKSRYSSTMSDEDFYKTVAERSFWATNKAGDGLTLKARVPTTDQVVPVKTVAGSEINVKFSDMDQLDFVLEDI